MAKTSKDEDKRRIGELEDELKNAKARNEELRLERDKQNDLITRLAEQIQECDDQINRWIDAFEMVLDDKGVWTWTSEVTENHDHAWFWKYVKLREKWNKFVGEYNVRVTPRGFGRPLAAGPGQVTDVLKRHKAGQSLRDIAEDTSLSFQTVRTIVDKKDGVDRATIKRLERIAPDKIAEARARRSSKEIAALPKRINENLKRNAELRKEAKGLR